MAKTADQPEIDYGITVGEYRTNGKKMVEVDCIDGDEAVVTDVATEDVTLMPAAILVEWQMIPSKVSK